MQRRHPQFANLVSLVLLSFVAAAGVPRDVLFAHRHAGDTPGHAHGWEGERVGRTSTSILDLLTGNDHGHDHDHAGAAHIPDGEHRHDHAHGHDHADEPAEHIAATPPAAAEHPHAGGGGPALASPGDPAHAHWQAPFQTAAATTLDLVVPTVLRRLQRGTAPVAAPVERALALRARSPPTSPV